MKKFADICMMTQAGVKEYMEKYLTSQGYEPINEDGFLYAKGTVPVLLVAHMDTVHKQQCKQIVDDNGRKSSPQGIGGDDRCGVFIIMNIVRELHCSVLLCEDEESGTVGARKFTKTDYIDNLDVNYMIEFDRKGSEDAVFYSCDNKDFTNFVIDATGFKFATGSFSDISVLMPAAKLAGVNLSCGYYKPHTVDEYVVYSEMMNTVNAALALIGTECEKPFEYVAQTYKGYPREYKPYSWSMQSEWKPYSWSNNAKHNAPSNGVVQGNFFDDIPLYADDKLAQMALNDTDLEIEVIYIDGEGEESTVCASGKTKDECWKNLFIENPDLCFNDIVDFSWS